MGVVIDTYEIRDLFRDALMSRNQRVLDRCAVTVILRLGVRAEVAERLLIEAKEMCPDDVQAYWEEPCDVCP